MLHSSKNKNVSFNSLHALPVFLQIPNSHSLNRMGPNIYRIKPIKKGVFKCDTAEIILLRPFMF